MKLTARMVLRLKALVRSLKPDFSLSRLWAKDFRLRTKLILFLLFALPVCHTYAQDPWKNLEKRPSTLGLEKGYLSFNVSGVRLKLVKASQTVAALSPAADTAFDFTPGERLRLRSSDGMYHLGDLDLRLRFA